MRLRNFITFIILIISGSLLFIIGCGDSDYDSGLYWLNKEKNPIMAARYLRRSLDKNPNSWKTHKALIQALSQTDDMTEFESQLQSTLSLFPNKIRDESIYLPSVQTIGEEKYDLLTAPIEQLALGRELGRKGDRPDILAKITMSSCRMRDTATAIDYFKRLLSAIEDGTAPDTVIQELGYLIGPSGVRWVELEVKIARNPDDIEARKAQINAGLIVGDSAATRRKLVELFDILPDALEDKSYAILYGNLLGIDPFQAKRLVNGWDGALSPDGRYIVYLKDLGRHGETDQYIYRASADGGNEVPIMKGNQELLRSLAWPCYSPDGRWIYFYGTKDVGWSPQNNVGLIHLYRIRPSYGSRPQRLNVTDLVPVLPHFNPNGTILLVMRDIGSIRSSVEIIKIDPNKQKTESISRIGEPVNGATFNVTGDSLIFITDRGIFRRSIQGGKITVDLAWRGLSFPFISPDGKFLLVSNRKNQILLIDRNTSKMTFIGSTPIPYSSFSKQKHLVITRTIEGKPHIVKLNLTSDINSMVKFNESLKCE